MRVPVSIAAALLAFALPASAVTLRVVEQKFDFAEDAVLDVVIAIEAGSEVAGLEFSIVYPGDLLAVAEPVSHTAGDFLGPPVVNPDADPAGLGSGSRRIDVAIAAAEPSGVAAGTVLTISFPLLCSDFSGDWPDGRLVGLQIVDAAAWGVGVDSLPEPIALLTVDGSLLIDCTTVPVTVPGFSALKARFGRGR